MHDAGGGELVFAESLNRFYDKIVISSSKFEISPHWNLAAGFDHGKTNPTAVLLCAIDEDGVIYCVSEYYHPGLTPQRHVYNLRRLPGLQNAIIHADPSIFYRTHAQSGEDFKSIADLYGEAGLTNLREAQIAKWCLSLMPANFLRHSAQRMAAVRITFFRRFKTLLCTAPSLQRMTPLKGSGRRTRVTCYVAVRGRSLKLTGRSLMAIHGYPALCIHEFNLDE